MRRFDFIIYINVKSKRYIAEALAMQRYLIQKGVPAEKIIREERATSTYENFVFSRRLLEQRFPHGFSSALITNDFHVYRAVRMAQYAGLTIRHMGAHTEWYTLPTNYLRESVAVLKYWLIPPQNGDVE